LNSSLKCPIFWYLSLNILLSLANIYGRFYVCWLSPTLKESCKLVLKLILKFCKHLGFYQLLSFSLFFQDLRKTLFETTKLLFNDFLKIFFAALLFLFPKDHFFKLFFQPVYLVEPFIKLCGKSLDIFNLFRRLYCIDVLFKLNLALKVT
jgi:hypothetical protein